MKLERRDLGVVSPQFEEKLTEVPVHVVYLRKFYGLRGNEQVTINRQSRYHAHVLTKRD